MKWQVGEMTEHRKSVVLTKKSFRMLIVAVSTYGTGKWPKLWKLVQKVFTITTQNSTNILCFIFPFSWKYGPIKPEVDFLARNPDHLQIISSMYPLVNEIWGILIGKEWQFFSFQVHAHLVYTMYSICFWLILSTIRRLPFSFKTCVELI